MGNRWIEVKEEVAYATLPGWSGVQTYPVTEFTATPNNNTMELKESVNLMAAGGILGGFTGNARLNMYARPDNLPYFFKWLWGTSTPTAGPPTGQIFTVTEPVKSFSLKYMHGYSGVNAIISKGNLVKSIELTAAQNRPCMANIALQYNTEDTNVAQTAPMAALSTVLRPYTLFDATVTSIGEQLKCENISITMERTIPDDAHTSGSRFLPDISEEGFAITGEFDARFTTLTQRAKFFGGAGSSTSPQNDFLTGALTCNFLGGAAPVNNYSMNFSLPAIAITEVESGTVNRERLRQRLRFQAYAYSSAGVPAVNQVTLLNGT